MPPKSKIRISFDVEGELARAFIDFRRKSLATKSVLGRAALVEYLNARGYNVEDTTAAWGSRPDQSEEEQDPELVAVAAW